jgi:hypothetical protein
MGSRWGRVRWRRAVEEDTGSRGATTERSAASANGREGATVVLDLTGSLSWVDRLEDDPVRVAARREAHRERAARREALRDLERLRARHWSGDRVIEEGRTDLEWWEHPDADPFAVLGLLPGATLDQAAAARRRVAQACHPDRLADDADAAEAERRMIAANAAYDRLRRALRPA